MLRVDQHVHRQQTTLICGAALWHAAAYLRHKQILYYTLSIQHQQMDKNMHAESVVQLEYAIATNKGL